MIRGRRRPEGLAASSSKRLEGEPLVDASAQGFHFFLEPELLSLQFLESYFVGGGPTQFILNGLFERLVTRSEFTDPGFHGHDVTSPRWTVVK